MYMEPGNLQPGLERQWMKKMATGNRIYSYIIIFVLLSTNFNPVYYGNYGNNNKIWWQNAKSKINNVIYVFVTWTK